MKDNVITLNGNVKCFVADEMTYKGKKYIFCIELDQQGELIEDKVYAFEVGVKNDTLITKQIEDFETASVINNMFIARQLENKNS